MDLRFINPNYHVILIHYPLGVFVLGVFLELFSIFWRRSTVRTAARWMIVLGALLSLPAATSGIYALHDVQRQGINDARYYMLRLHVIYMGIASILAVTCAVIGIGASDAMRRRLYLPLLLGVVVAWGLMVVGAWHGGETIYQHGTSVAIIDVDSNGQPQLKELPKETHSLKKIREMSADDKYSEVVNYYVGGDWQQHFIMAGFAFAFAMGALGLSIRKLHPASVVVSEITTERVATGAAGEQRRVTDDMTVIRSLNPGTGMRPLVAWVPSGRFWMLTALIILVTACLGYWAQTSQSVLTSDAWRNEFLPKLHGGKWPFSRHMAHLVLAGAFFVIVLILGLLAVAAPRKSFLLSFFGLLLVAVIAAQVWIGVLLAFDHEGPLNKFKAERLKVKIEKTEDSGTSTAPTTAPVETLPPAAPLPATRPSIFDSFSASTTAPVAPALPPVTAPPVTPPATIPDLPAISTKPVATVPATRPAVDVPLPTPIPAPPAAKTDSPTTSDPK